MWIMDTDRVQAPNPFDRQRVKTLQDYKISQVGPFILRKISI